ncbi:ATP-binding protein [Massilia sp. DWR3-1-1]|uniref:ATP-binding protein n=1 Tax=Massilia sp. DWR3-1-1 TaxID=2804559 RepID=UPI003CF0B4E6
MKARAALLRPTLVRRAMLTLLIAFALVWLVLLGKGLYDATDRAALDRTLLRLGENLLTLIGPLEAPAEARAAVAASATLIDDSYRASGVPGAVLMELRNADGARLFVSAKGVPAGLHGMAGQIVGASADGQPYRLYEGRRGRWTLLVAAPILPTSWLVKALGGPLALDMVIALPFVMLPLWFAVTRALAPLRKLSGQLTARGPDDLSALVAVPVHAELQPLVSALDHLLGQLRHKVAREQAFVQDAAHELRTPMAVLAAQAHVLAMTTDNNERTAAARRMAQAIGRASHLLSQLLDLACMDQGAQPAAAALDLAQPLRQALALLAPAALARQIVLSLEAPDALPYPLEAGAWQSIVQNLLNNAIAYVPDHSHISVRLQALHKGVLLSVADDGPGIAPALRTRVFERFYRGSGHAAPGAGLGLAIVREAARRHGGSVTLDDGIGGKGCTFSVTLQDQNG